MKLRILLAALAALTVIVAVSRAGTCESLSSLALPLATITEAVPVPAGDSVQPRLPAFCRVAATLKPSSDSDIKIEVWLPANGWNGKFQAVGNGGWAGVISYDAMAEALRGGYATASTDTGHAGGRGTFALDHPEKLTDFGYRAVHEMTLKAKAIVEAFYGTAARFSYWNGCSTGGRQGLKEAQRFPNDYDGVIAGASANPRTRLSGWQIWLSQVVLQPENYIPASKYPVIHKALLEACDAGDGLKDGLIADPTRCRFDPITIECKGADAPTCLTAGQVRAAERMYTAPKNPRTGTRYISTCRPAANSAGACWRAARSRSQRPPISSVTWFSRTRTGIGTRSTWRRMSGWPIRWITTPSTRRTPI